MKKLLKLSTAFVVIAALTFACNKEQLDNTSNSTLGVQSTNKEQAKISEEESADIAKTIKEIEGYKEKFDNWRQGKNTQELIDTKSAGEQIEMIWNYKVSRPGTVFEKYEFVTAVAEVGTKEVKEWTGADAAHAYEAVKEQIVKLYNGIEGSDKGINMIDMGNPSFENGKLIMYIQMNVGVGAIEDGAMPNAEGRNSFFRWALDPMGFVQVGCGSASNQEIALSVNQTLGFFLKNLPPYSNGANPKVSSVQILSAVDHVQTNYFGTGFPLGPITNPPNITVSTQPLFVVKTTTLPNSGVTSPYLNQGQYKIHADVSFGANNFPDENCFNITKLGSYCITNKEAGEGYTGRVNTTLATNFNTRRRLLSTYVGSSALSTDNPLTVQAPDVYLQEHPTYHFYGRVANVIVACCIEPAPVEMM